MRKMGIAIILLGAAAMALAVAAIRRAEQLKNALAAKNAELTEKQVLVTEWMDTAEAFQQTGNRFADMAELKTKELKLAGEHVQELRARCRKLEDTISELKSQRRALEERLMQEHERAEHFRERMTPTKYPGGAARDLQNILSYTGREQVMQHEE